MPSSEAAQGEPEQPSIKRRRPCLDPQWGNLQVLLTHLLHTGTFAHLDGYIKTRLLFYLKKFKSSLGIHARHSSNTGFRLVEAGRKVYTAHVHPHHLPVPKSQM